MFIDRAFVGREQCRDERISRLLRSHGRLWLIGRLRSRFRCLVFRYQTEFVVEVLRIVFTNLLG